MPGHLLSDAFIFSVYVVINVRFCLICWRDAQEPLGMCENLFPWYCLL